MKQADRDRGKKRQVYQQAGTAEYSIVDSDARIVERWMPNDKRPEIVDTSLEWVASADQRVQLDFAALFHKALGPL